MTDLLHVPASHVLELGVGNNPKIDKAVRHDRYPREGVDVAHDLNVMPWPFEDGQFDLVVANDVFEHLDVPVVDWLNECWRILKGGGGLWFRVPKFGTPNHVIDPTHIRGFHISSFDFFVPGTHWHENNGKFYNPKGWWWAKESARQEGDNLAFWLRKVNDGNPAGINQHR